MNRFSLRVAVAFVCLCGLPELPLRAQQASPGSAVKVVTFGGFLGYVDGLPEKPAGDQDPTPDGPAGGLVGVRRLLAKPGLAGGLRLVTGNNMPRYRGLETIEPTSADHPFWKLLQSLQPAAVAIGTEDVAHALLVPNGASDLAFLAQKWAARAAGERMRFVASNLFIKAKSRGLNHVRDGAYHLEVPADESLGLLRRMSVACDQGCANQESATLDDLGPIGNPGQRATHVIAASPEADGKHWTIDLGAAPLRPGRQYRLDIHGATFTFQTISAVTPAEDGLPVVTHVDGGVTYRILSFVQPEILDNFPAASRQWKKGARDAAPCASEACEIVILAPSAAWTSLAPRVPHGPSDGLLVAMTDLHDETLLELLQLTPAFRIVTVAPDTNVLGRASAEDKKNKFGGDLGYNAIVDASPDSGLTRVMMRPEWLGESVHTFTAGLVVPQDAPRAKLEHPETEVAFVPGAPLQARLEGGLLQYFVTDGAETINVGGRYPAYPKYDGTNTIFGNIPTRDLWTNANSMTAFLLELVRRGTASDIAVLDDAVVDGSVTSWLNGEELPFEFLSRFILERAFFRPSRMVRVAVPGSQVAAYLGRVVAAGKSFDARLWMAGIGAPGVALNRVDGDTLKINGREIVKGEFYSVAMPQRYAAALGEARPEHPFELAALMDDADRTFGPVKDLRTGLLCVTYSASTEYGECRTPARSGRPRPSPSGGSLARDLEARRSAIPRGVFYVSKGTFEASGLRSNQTSDLALSAVPEDGRDGTKFRNIAGSIAAEAGLSSSRGTTLSIPVTADYSHKRLGDPVKETYPANSWSVNLKLAQSRHFMPLNLHGFYATAGFQSNFIRTTKAPETATSRGSTITSGTGASQTKSVTSTSIALTSDPFPRPPLDFTIAGGADFEDVGKTSRVSLTGMTLAFSRVRRARDLVGLTTSGREVTADQLTASSAQKIVDDLFKAEPDVVKADPRITYRFGTTTYHRLDVTATGSWKMFKTQWGQTSLSLENKYRWYPPDGAERLIAARQTLESKLKLTWPLLRRLDAAPYVNAFWLKLRGTGRTFQILEYGVKFQFPFFESKGPGHAHK